MSDWVQSQDFNRVTIGVDSVPESIGIELGALQSSAPLSAVWPAVDRAIFVPFVVYQPLIVVKLGVRNGAAVSGNVDCGIYDDQQNRLVSIGSTAQAGTSQFQSFDVTDTLLEPGVYYQGLCVDNTTAAFISWAVSQTYARACGVLSQSVGAVTLPNPAVFAAAQDAYVPAMFLTGRTLI